MSKEYRIPKNIKEQDLVRGIINASYWHWKTIDKVQHTEAITYLNKLESIANVKPNEAIECLEKIKDGFGCDMAYFGLNLEYENVELALLKTQGLEKEYNKLKAQMNYLTEVVTEYQKILKIIKEKRVNVDELLDCIRLCDTDSEVLDKYNHKVSLIWNDPNDYLLTQEEIELLKRWLV